jgi:hypothetical protein
MNKHIELVKKWLDNPDSVTQQELKDNRAAAYAAAYAASAAVDARSAYTTSVAVDARSADAEYWVKLYEELTK